MTEIPVDVWPIFQAVLLALLGYSVTGIFGRRFPCLDAAFGTCIGALLLMLIWPHRETVTACVSQCAEKDAAVELGFIATYGLLYFMCRITTPQAEKTR